MDKEFENYSNMDPKSRIKMVQQWQQKLIQERSTRRDKTREERIADMYSGRERMLLLRQEKERIHQLGKEITLITWNEFIGKTYVDQESKQRDLVDLMVGLIGEHPLGPKRQGDPQVIGFRRLVGPGNIGEYLLWHFDRSVGSSRRLVFFKHQDHVTDEELFEIMDFAQAFNAFSDGLSITICATSRNLQMPPHVDWDQRWGLTVGPINGQRSPSRLEPPSLLLRQDLEGIWVLTAENLRNGGTGRLLSMAEGNLGSRYYFR